MIQTVKNLIMKLFGVTSRQTDTEMQRAALDVMAYRDINRENMTAIFANALSTLAFSEGTVTVSAGKDKPATKRSQLLDEIMQKHWRGIKQNIAVGNGCGMIVSIPYSVSGGLGRKIYIDTVSKERVYITGTQGDDITKITVLSDIYIDGNGKSYYRLTDYGIENGVYIIRQKATKNGVPCELSEVEDWSGISPEIRISGCDRLPVGVYRCPASNRRPKTIDGVPITYGCNATMDKIAKCFMDIEKEFDDKKAKIFADPKLFDKNERLTDLYRKIRTDGRLGDGKSIDIFDPAFRDTSYFNRLDRYFALLEKEVGTSRGILTDLNAGSGATATEIKRAMHPTFALCDDIRKNTQGYLSDLMYGVNVLANYYGITPPGEYEITYDWSYSMIEDSESTFRQLVDGHKVGAVDSVDIRRFLIPTETEEEAITRVKQIFQSENGNEALTAQQKIWAAEVASGLASPVEYRMKIKGEDEATAAKMLPQTFNGGDNE